jgi:hypothetical protein
VHPHYDYTCPGLNQYLSFAVASCIVMMVAVLIYDIKTGVIGQYLIHFQIFESIRVMMEIHQDCIERNKIGF